MTGLLGSSEFCPKEIGCSGDDVLFPEAGDLVQIIVTYSAIKQAKQ